MKKKVLITALTSINVAVICLLLWRVKIIDNDKGPLLIIFFYPIQIILNLILALILRLLRNDMYKLVLKGVLVLLILLIPIIIIAGQI